MSNDPQNRKLPSPYFSQTSPCAPFCWNPKTLDDAFATVTADLRPYPASLNPFRLNRFPGAALRSSTNCCSLETSAFAGRNFGTPTASPLRFFPVSAEY